MYTMAFEITVGDFKLAMLDKVEIHKSVEILADRAIITLPAARHNIPLEVESKLRRGDKVRIAFGYEELGLVDEFEGYLQRIESDTEKIVLTCEDDLHTFRKSLKNEVVQKITLKALLEKVITGAGLSYKLDCSYAWTYAKFTINNATAFDVLKKVQEECGADIYLHGDTLHVHPPGEMVGQPRYYDFTVNVEKSDLAYRLAVDKKVQVVVKATLPDGTVREVETGSTGGDKIEIKCATSDKASMKARGDAEVLRRSFDGYDGSLTTWLIPLCLPADSANIADPDYPARDGAYFVRSVTTTFSKEGGVRKVELGFRLS